jgi:predicted nucleotidyltransferase
MTVHPAQTRLHLQRRLAAARAAGDERARRLRARLPEAVRILRAVHGARDVVLFGSLARGDATADSDVDLAVGGLPAPNYFRALADLMAVFCGPVDLVRLEEAVSSLRDRIEAEGQRL